MSDAVGFWSYARADDDAEEGRIVRLGQLLKAEYELLTGESLTLFIDRDAIEWGEQWRARIDEALAGTTFFIPVVTPRFFERAECRRELLTFAGTARSLDLEELILPVHYVPVPDLDGNAPSVDEAVALIKAREWEDWREARLEDSASSIHRRAVNRLAKRLAEIAREVRERPETISDAGRDGAPPTGEAGDELEPGVIDVLAKGEEKFPRMPGLITEAGSLVGRVGEAMRRATEEIEKSDRRGGGFAGRLTVSRKLADELAEPASELEALGREFASLVLDIDPAILTAIRLVEANPEQLESTEVQEFFGAIKQMVRASRESVASTDELLRSLEAAASTSRDLRHPIRQLQSGLRGLADGQTVYDEWERQIAKLESAHS